MLLPFVPIRSCFLLLWQRETIILEGLLVLGTLISLSFVKVSLQNIILPVLSPLMKELQSVLFVRTDTDPMWPTSALMDFPFYQK